VSSVDYAGWKRVLAEERLPAVVVDLDAFDRNVRKLAGYASGGEKRLRLATKSLRVPELIRRVLAAGAPYQGLMCYSAEEAARLREQGFDDLLVAYPTVQARDLALLRRLHEQGALVAATVDHVDSLRALAAAMKGVGKPFRFIADVDMSLRPFGGLLHLGVRRSPLHSARDVAALMDEATRHAPAVRFVGALAYEAQVAGLGDRNPFKRLMNPVFSLVRRISVGTVARIRRDLGELFRERGLAPEIFNGGGTGSIDTAAGGDSAHGTQRGKRTPLLASLRLLLQCPLRAVVLLRPPGHAFSGAGVRHVPGRRLHRLRRAGLGPRAAALSASGRGS
jgi:D-serine deaminase-like pyridoxal phosphate-dependent protein